MTRRCRGSSSRSSGRPTRVTICARSWRLLEPFAGRPRHPDGRSVGTTWELRRLRRRFSGGRLAGVSIHERLLDVATLSELHRLTTLVVTWPGQFPPAGARADRAGVDGLISDDPTPARLPPAGSSPSARSTPSPTASWRSTDADSRSRSSSSSRTSDCGRLRCVASSRRTLPAGR